VKTTENEAKASIKKIQEKFRDTKHENDKGRRDSGRDAPQSFAAFAATTEPPLKLDVHFRLHKPMQ
jgi:hypothetical protein